MPKLEKNLIKVKDANGDWKYIPVGGSGTPSWTDVTNKPFSTLGGGLEVDENGVLSAQGGGGGSDNAVQYVAQELTDEQKAQARENIGAIGSPQSATVGDVLTVEEVDGDGKPTKWKTAPAAEQVQADITEDDESSPAYIRNNPFTPVMRYEERLDTGTYNNISAYYYYFNNGNIGDEKFMLEVDDKKIYNIEPSFEAFKEAFIAAGLTWIGNTKTSIYFTAPDSSTSIKFGAQCARLDSYSLPPHTSQKAGVFDVDEMNVTDSESNYDRCVYKYDSGLIYPMLYAPKSIKTYDKFDIGATIYSSKGHMAYYLAEGTASTQLGLTENDYPVMTYCTDSYYGSAGKNMFFYIETATGRRFKTKKDEYNNTSWDTFEEISTSSGGSSVFYINITSSTDSDGNTTYSADKTADEIVAAYDSGALMMAIVDKSYIPCTFVDNSTTLLYLIFELNEYNEIINAFRNVYAVIDIYKSAKTISISYGDTTIPLGKNIALIYNDDGNSVGSPMGDAATVLSSIALAFEYENVFDIVLAIGYNVYNVSSITYSSNTEILCKFDDVHNSKTHIITINSEDNTFTYSEESLPSGSTYTLPVATADALGGVKADAATDEDTQDVRITANGKLMTKAGGGGKTWELAGSQDVAEDVLSVSIPVTSARDYLVQISLQNSSQTSGQRALQVSFNKNNNTKAVTQSANIFNSSGSRSIFVKFSRVDGRIMWRVCHNLNGGGIVDENVENMGNFNAGAFTPPSDIQNITISNHNSIAGYYIGAGSKIRVYTRGV